VPESINASEKKTTTADYLTVEQVQDAANVWLAARNCPPPWRMAVCRKAACRISYYQGRNRQARRAARRASLRQLHRLGINLGSLKSCVPHDG
jgi:hypothetical protein